MTDSLTAPRTSRHAGARGSAVPATRRRVAGWAVAGGVVAGPLFLAAGVTQGLVRDGFTFRRNAISQLALGEGGWVQTVNFLVAGLLLTGAAWGLRQVLRGGPGGTWGPALLGVFGVSFWVAAGFPADAGAGFPAGAPEATVMTGHGAVHMLGGMVGYLALCAASVALGRALAARGPRAWAVASRVVPVSVLAGFLASAVSVLAFTLAAGLGLLWLAAVAARLAGDDRG
ncbi:DUF998 domain-containing protein [Streptomyces sp. R302]|uniref:DUF998 domain-containing protein n=1 Tax=unclassified Streptomyces TaxID=2593676 RepID=UPI00145E310D|nr:MULTISPECIES: DUF998 domain-containing protein [unclassified Streptomyces]NML52644.1 DUF998 domain-containing protein [Streptomyces sp. R301]NML80427.1 DUF998 domain-containing protein [Streptomyces sp. R302]